MYYEVPKERLLSLLRAEIKLGLLEDYGVDNWDCYDDAVNDSCNDGEYAANNIPEDELLKEFKEIK